MLNNLFRQLINSCGVVLRTFRAFFSRQIMGIRARARRITSFSRQAAKLVPKAMNSVAVAGKKPTKREDFVETKRLFVAKSFLYLLIVGIVAFALLAYFVIWPWLQSRFFTKRFFAGDAAVAAYSGKVVVCYDEEKTEPKLQGRLEEGVLGGQVKEFDAKGRIAFEGAYADGMRAGQGRLYENGVLVYEGGFAAGVYEGRGKLYENGQPLYEGDFAAGVFQGEGKLYENGELRYEGGFASNRREGTGTEYAGGTVSYKGEFSDGVYNGEGKAYYPNGQLKYQGGYVDGLCSGEGTAFYDNGQTMYKGGFLLGEYESEGVLYTPEGMQKYAGGFAGGLYQNEGVLRVDEEYRVEGVFERGSVAGEAAIYRNGKLWYRGEVNGTTPHGQGMLYSSSGTLIYQGAMREGTADAGGLLELTAAEVRAMFGEARLTETPGEKAGFSINNEALGVTLFCTYKQESDDPTVYYVYAYDKNSDPFANAMPYHNAAEYEAEASGYDKRVRQERAAFTGGVPYPKGTYFRTAYYYEDYVFVGWSESEGGDWLMVEWITLKSLPPAGAAAGASLSAAKLSGVLASLGLTSGQAPAEPDAEGGAALTAAIKGIGFGQRRSTVLAALAQYYAGAENKAIYEEELALYTSLLTDERQNAAMGNGDPARAAELEAAVSRLELSIAKAGVAMKKAENAAGEAGLDALGELNGALALLCADPASLERDALIQAGGGAAEEALMELDVAYLELGMAVEAYEAARAEEESVLGDYAAGRADEAAKAEAATKRCEAAAEANGALAAYTGLLLKLDAAVLGKVTKALGYFTD